MTLRRLDGWKLVYIPHARAEFAELLSSNANGGSTKSCHLADVEVALQIVASAVQRSHDGEYGVQYWPVRASAVRLDVSWGETVT